MLGLVRRAKVIDIIGRLMPTKSLTLVLAAALAGLVAVPTPPAHARDLVKAAAALVLAEEPPPTRSEVLEKQRREEAARTQVEKKKEPDTTPYYKKWWFWALTAAVVGGTVALGAWAVEPTSKPARMCSNDVIGCFGDGRTGSR
jgi:hypothetical protein